MKIDKDKLDRAMLAAGVDTVKGLAEQADVNTNTISRIRSGCAVVKPQTIQKLAQALQISPVDLLAD